MFPSSNGLLVAKMRKVFCEENCNKSKLLPIMHRWHRFYLFCQTTPWPRCEHNFFYSPFRNVGSFQRHWFNILHRRTSLFPWFLLPGLPLYPLALFDFSSPFFIYLFPLTPLLSSLCCSAFYFLFFLSFSFLFALLSLLFFLFSFFLSFPLLVF